MSISLVLVKRIHSDGCSVFWNNCYFFITNSLYVGFLITYVMQIAARHLKALEYFFGEPFEEVYLRELARRVDLSVFSLKTAVDDLVDEGLLVERRVGRLRFLRANMENLFFRFLKIAFNVKKIVDCGVVVFLKECVPALSSVVLFGSWAKGENDKKSDVDILVIGQRPVEFDVSGFEARLECGLELIVMRWSEWMKKAKEDKAFYLEVITNGVLLYGNLPVID